MSVAVELVDERGVRVDGPRNWPGWRVAQEGPQPAWDWKPPSSDPAYPTLSGIDPYGDTTFNRLQVGDVLGELQRWRQRCDPPQVEMTDEVIRLAEACRDETHLYLRFVGD